jgi:hypothetical protein
VDYVIFLLCHSASVCDNELDRLPVLPSTSGECNPGLYRVCLSKRLLAVVRSQVYQYDTSADSVPDTSHENT